ncbi:carboxypeptidase-like regulatory domain-containing protein [Flavobacterium sp.]|uniref:carboxypeptidase-like regulatory domain-containing protein n=1 Tax=Flavobacterium sp. TaxID=239 RepID=UPI002B4B2F05|nr:carboxypeptidase-like regulatory domain-containing protein [Flavobacterium sp.]HLP64619.1 carboxypeptidase-like regulatory domain-containing protein [Flavobacterium sp.]
MSKKINVTIPKPCSENWLEMTPSEQGRFCQLCQENVFDFTQSSDREIVEKLEKNQFLCGRFSRSQLDRKLIIPKKRNSLWMATSSAFISFIGLGTQEVYSQGRTKIEQTDKKNASEIDFNKEYVLKGIVLDENKSPLPNLKILVKEKLFSTLTNEDGEFKIKIKPNDVLIINHDGLKTVEIYANRTAYMSIILEKNETEFRPDDIMGKSAINEERRTLLGKFFNSIANLFR